MQRCEEDASVCTLMMLLFTSDEEVQGGNVKMLEAFFLKSSLCGGAYCALVINFNRIKLSCAVLI